MQSRGAKFCYQRRLAGLEASLRRDNDREDEESQAHGGRSGRDRGIGPMRSSRGVGL